MNLSKHIAFLLLLLAPFAGRTQEATPQEAPPGIDVQGIVLGHLADSYEWHITTLGHREVSVPLPVIVRGSDGVWHLFSSARLREGAVYKGFSIATDGKYDGKLVEAGVRPKLDLSLTKNALALLINSAVMLLLVLPLARWYRRGRELPPRGIAGAVELVAEYINREVIEPCVGPEARRYAPLLLTMFFFILVNNLMGLIPIFPGGANVTGNIAVTLVLAVTTFLAVNLSGTKAYWKDILWPDVPMWLKVPAPLMPVIEIFGVFTKPFALMVRLFANMFAGHAVILALVCVIFTSAALGAAIQTGMSVVAVVFGVFMLCLELLVAFIQAYVFTLLSGVFIGMARVKHEHK